MGMTVDRRRQILVWSRALMIVLSIAFALVAGAGLGFTGAVIVEHLARGQSVQAAIAAATVLGVGLAGAGILMSLSCCGSRPR
jgi:hypothetical protein